LLHAIPLEFFSIVVLLITFLSIYFQWKTLSPGNPVQLNDVPKGKVTMTMQEEKEPMIEPRISNLIIPLFAVIGLSTYFFWHFGSEKVSPNSSLLEIIGATDANKAMLVGLLISIAITGSIYFFQKYKISDMTVDFISGGNEIVKTLAILGLGVVSCGGLTGIRLKWTRKTATGRFTAGMEYSHFTLCSVFDHNLLYW
jgi:hypothetical protein